LEQVVIDANMWEEYRAFMRNFSVTEETSALDVIKRVGQGNNFLNDPHTVRNFRSQMFMRGKKTDLYGSTMSERMVPDARAVVKKTLAEHAVEHLDKNILSKGNALVAEYAGQRH
jgi:trimethylamine--corrinoid protein Co-methyltransferase